MVELRNLIQHVRIHLMPLRQFLIVALGPREFAAQEGDLVVFRSVHDYALGGMAATAALRAVVEVVSEAVAAWSAAASDCPATSA